ncbi:MAG: hypothetical protein ABI761_17020, partial [Saprospiraceae bacterium]
FAISDFGKNGQSSIVNRQSSIVNFQLFLIPDHIILPYILPDIEPESHNEVDDNRRSQRKKGKIDKV